MSWMFRHIVMILLGFILTVYGSFHAFEVYPARAVFARMIEALPALGMVLSFAVGVACAIAGLVFLAVAVHRLRRPRRQPAPMNSVARVPARSYRQAGLYDEEFDPEDETYEYRGDYGRDQFDSSRHPDGTRLPGNGEPPDRRHAGSYRG